MTLRNFSTDMNQGSALSQYESLRTQVLARSGLFAERSLGLALFMRIPLIPASHSSRSRPPIPRDPGHPFQVIPAR
jgi:hypothetical protein